MSSRRSLRRAPEVLQDGEFLPSTQSKSLFLPRLGDSVAFPNCLNLPHVDVDTAEAKDTWLVLDAESR